MTTLSIGLNATVSPVTTIINTLSSTTRSPTATTLITSLTCQNTALDSTCDYFAVNYGYCNKIAYLNSVLFSVACKKTCNLCNNVQTTTTQPLTQAACVDNQSSCSFWASYCNLLVNLNPHPCPKTCNVCTAKETTTTSTTTTTTTTTSTTNANCVDRSLACPYWTNYCYLLVNQKPHPCLKTCKLC